MPRVEKNRTGPSRSRPVSCLFCRSRKLRCSRQFPCANCSSRGLTCQLESMSVLSTSSADEGSDQPSGNFQQNVLARLRKLEEIVITQREPTRSPSDQSGSRPGPPPRRKREISTSFTENSSTVDVEWLESQITHPGSTVGLCIAEYEFKTCSIREATPATPVVDGHEMSPTKIIWLPLHEESKQIVDKYLTDITFLHHVVHGPSVRALVDELYGNLSTKSPVKLGQVSLLLAILANTVFFWTEQDMHRTVFPSVMSANDLSKRWMAASFEVLEYSRFTCSESLEDIQALIIVAFLVCNIVGITSQARYLFSTAVSIAWQLSLHRIDHKHNAELSVPHPSSVKAEIGRRVWWYLVATDWQMSQFGGSQKGIYMISPRHMATKKPSNANDEDLFDGMVNIDKPLDQPTIMSYFIQRIRLGEICREISDQSSFLDTDLGGPDYEQVKEIDGRICEFSQALPPFLHLDYDTGDIPEPGACRPPVTIVHRYIINSMLQTQRCRLHLPYLSHAQEAIYSYSRDACLDAARMVIRMEAQLSSEDIPFFITRHKFSGSLLCVCMAIVALLMDFCHNKSLQPNEDRERRNEIKDALKILEKSKSQSSYAGKLLDTFSSILQRNKVPLPSEKRSSRSKNANWPKSPASVDSATISVTPGTADLESILTDTALPSLEYWQTSDASFDPSIFFDWNSLLSELDAPFLSI
ncbi:hypothetical protein PMG11_01836 [Penicillium brasilianum]|uniref:Zn(2)-C6 fungal-type domain-containing protein n=1 Tax=Penicillium brasilianum TaxID=104259 RepID=A0A0F7TGD5_PENBI|nr:hypothetical protein PMG11_01836 [Penicillium brasilianum]